MIYIMFSHMNHVHVEFGRNELLIISNRTALGTHVH